MDLTLKHNDVEVQVEQQNICFRYKGRLGVAKGCPCLAALAEVGVGGRSQRYQRVPARASLMLNFKLEVSAEIGDFSLNLKMPLFCCTFAPCMVNAQPATDSHLGTK